YGEIRSDPGRGARTPGRHTPPSFRPRVPAAARTAATLASEPCPISGVDVRYGEIRRRRSGGGGGGDRWPAECGRKNCGLRFRRGSCSRKLEFSCRRCSRRRRRSGDDRLGRARA
ncbi:unnamed protein product, partial [Laminaria digitata]